MKLHSKRTGEKATHVEPLREDDVPEELRLLAQMLQVGVLRRMRRRFVADGEQ